MLTSFGCFEGSRATGSAFQLFRKPGAVGSSTRKTRYTHTRRGGGGGGGRLATTVEDGHGHVIPIARAMRRVVKRIGKRAFNFSPLGVNFR